jgi:hypothetical protein
MPAWMRKKSEPKKVETPTTDATSNDANKTQNTQQTTQSNLFQNQQGANKQNNYSSGQKSYQQDDRSSYSTSTPGQGDRPEMKEIPTDLHNYIYTRNFLFALRTPNEVLPDDETSQNLKENSLWTDGYTQAPISRETNQNLTSGFQNQDKNQQGGYNRDSGSRGGRGNGRGGRGGRGGQQQSGGTGRPADKPQTQDDKQKRPTKKKEDVDLFFGKMRSLLNKLTVEKFDQLAEKMVNLFKSIDSQESLQASIELVHNKALTEPHFSAMYSDLCKRLSDNCPALGDGKSTFRSVLLNQCQIVFEEKIPVEVDEEQSIKMRRRIIGNVVFIGELFKIKLFPEKIIQRCMSMLLDKIAGVAEGAQQLADAELAVQQLCKLLVTVEGRLDKTPQQKKIMDEYWTKIEQASKNKLLASRLRFMIKDVVEQRKNNWVPRRKVSGPKTIGEIHLDAALEDMDQELSLNQPVAAPAPKAAPTPKEDDPYVLPPQPRVMIRKTDLEPVATPDPKTSYEERIQKILEEYALDDDLEETTQAMTSTSNVSSCLTEIINFALDQHNATPYVNLFLHLNSIGFITPLQAEQELLALIDNLAELSLDAPFAYKTLGEFIHAAKVNQILEHLVIDVLLSRSSNADLAKNLKNYVLSKTD